jgi:hypothetical protein
VVVEGSLAVGVERNVGFVMDRLYYRLYLFYQMAGPTEQAQTNQT